MSARALSAQMRVSSMLFWPFVYTNTGYFQVTFRFFGKLLQADFTNPPFTVTVWTGNQGFSACPFCLTSSFGCDLIFTLSPEQHWINGRNSFNLLARLHAGVRIKHTSAIPRRQMTFSWILLTLYPSLRCQSTHDSPFPLRHCWCCSWAIFANVPAVIWLLIGHCAITLRYSIWLGGCLKVYKPACVWMWFFFF